MGNRKTLFCLAGIGANGIPAESIHRALNPKDVLLRLDRGNVVPLTVFGADAAHTMVVIFQRQDAAHIDPALHICAVTDPLRTSEECNCGKDVIHVDIIQSSAALFRIKHRRRLSGSERIVPG